MIGTNQIEDKWFPIVSYPTPNIKQIERACGRWIHGEVRNSVLLSVILPINRKEQSSQASWGR